MFAARAAFRSPALRRGIHTGRTSNSARSSFALSGAVLVAGGAAYAAYYSWDMGTRSRRIALEEAEPKPRKAPPAKSVSKDARKSADNTSADAPAPAKPIPTEPGVIAPSGEAPDPTPAAGSSPPNDEEELSEEDKDRAASQGAYNPETGEINWDCPCLGGMAHGPCGPQFREAFSCFVNSNEEPKGVDCVEKFKAMQDCFREHPDVYGEEIDDDDEEETPEGSEKPQTPPESDPSDERDAPSPPPDDKSSSLPDDKPSPPLDDKPSPPTDDKSSPPPKSKPGEEQTPDTPPDVPSPPSSAPPSRASAPTANVSPGKTPTKSAKSH